jgi:hypothetical protein
MTKERQRNLNKKYCEGPRGTYSAALRNTYLDIISFKPSYAVLSLQMFPTQWSFLEKSPLAVGGKNEMEKLNKSRV